jgi:hypothetical protein
MPAQTRETRQQTNLPYQIRPQTCYYNPELQEVFYLWPGIDDGDHLYAGSAMMTSISITRERTRYAVGAALPLNPLRLFWKGTLSSFPSSMR